MTEPVQSHGFTALGPLQEGLARLRGLPAHGVAILLGAFAALGFAPFHITPVLIVSLVGLVWMIDGARAHRRWGKAVFARGWAFGFGFFLIGMHWTASPFLVEPEKHAILLWMPLVLLPGGMALIWGAAAAFAGSFWSSSPSRIFVFAFWFAVAEWVRGHLFGGFPWNLPGTTFVPGGALSQAASIGGVYWLTLLVLFVCAAPAAMVDTRENKGLMPRLLPALLAVILVASGWAWGSQRLSQPTQFTDKTITLMDAGVPQAGKWDYEPDVILRRYLQLLSGVESGPKDIVIWPEGALTFRLYDPPGRYDIQPMLRNSGTMDAISTVIGERYLIAGTARYLEKDEFLALNEGADLDGLELPESPALRPPASSGRRSDEGPEERYFYNSMAVLDKTSSRSGHLALYDKHRLVPIGELPVARIIPFGETLANFLPGALQRQAKDGFTPGTGPEAPYTNTGDDIPPFVAMICYEGLFPEIAPKVRPRADWIVLISNDGWFGGGIGPAQHYAQNRYRAIETGLPMARVASRGTSAIVDGMGREILRGSVQPGDPEGWKSSVARGALPTALPSTLHERNRAAYFWLTLALFALLAFLAWRR